MSAKNKKKICLIFASGSLLSIRANQSVFFVDEEKDMKQWLNEIPELGLVANIEPIFVCGENTQFDLDTIERIADVLKNRRALFDGFVVIVRADRVVSTSVAVEYMLQGFGKPIIFTGSRHSPRSIAIQDVKKIIKMGGLGLRSNIINAAQIATDDNFPLTALMFGNKVIKPTKAVRSNFYNLNLFRSADEEYLGRIDFGISLPRPKKSEFQKRFSLALSRSAVALDTTTIASSTALNNLQKADVLLLRISENDIFDVPTYGELHKRFPVIILFNENYVLDQSCFAMLTHMTWHTAQMKVLWAHAAAKNNEEFRSLLIEDPIDEKIAI